MGLRHEAHELSNVKIQVRVSVVCPLCEGGLTEDHRTCWSCSGKGKTHVSQGITLQELKELLLVAS